MSGDCFACTEPLDPVDTVPLETTSGDRVVVHDSCFIKNIVASQIPLKNKN